MREAALGEEYRIEPVTLSQIMNDYGNSLGEYAMEREAFTKFRAAASDAGIKYQTVDVDFRPDLTLFNFDGVKMHED